MPNELNQAKIHTIYMQRLIKIIFISCIASQVFLIIFDYIFNYLDIFDEKNIRRIWNIARENSIPTWFSSTQTQLLGVTVFLIAMVQAANISRFKTFIWILIGLFFLWIGIDDAAEIHEKLGGALERIMKKDGGESGVITQFLLQNPSFSWHTFIAPFFILCGLGMVIFLLIDFWQLKLWQAKLSHYIILVFLGFGCWAIAQGIDFIEGLENADNIYKSIQQSLEIKHKYGVTHTFKVVEEVLEMFGTTLLWVGFLYYLAHISNGLQLKITNK
ncbi:MAG: hypothetical protein KAH84_04340 [Thiomargarita sp.]|nr:hypothetical protein [Thiomargarita sp.]